MKKFEEFTVRIPVTDGTDAAELKRFVEGRIKGTGGVLKKRDPLYTIAQNAKVLRPYRKRSEARA